MQEFITRHGDRVLGVVSGFDRVRVRGTLRWIANLSGMRAVMYRSNLLLKDFTSHMQQLTNQIRDNTQSLARSLGRPLKYLPSSRGRKEDMARAIAERDGIDTGLICVFSSVEPCFTYEIHRNRKAQRLELRAKDGKCLHYYFYLNHEQLGLMHMRLQTWCPFNIHMCINGRSWLARQLDQAGIGYLRRDNCFVHIDDVAHAQQVLDRQPYADWPGMLNEAVARYHPTHPKLFPIPLEYYWSADQTEWATDVMFKSPKALSSLYPHLVRHNLLTMASPDVMRFLGRPTPTHGHVHGHFHGEVSSDVKHRPEGVRISHRVNHNSIKMYDKQGSVLRVETTINDPRDMKVYRQKEGDPEDAPKKWRKLRKGVSDLPRRTRLSQKANERYLDAMASVESPKSLGELVSKLCKPAKLNGQRVRALNPLAMQDLHLLRTISRGEFAIHGFRNHDLRKHLFKARPRDKAQQRKQATNVTRQLRLLRAHGLIQKVPRTHRYQLTPNARAIITALLSAYGANPKQLQDLKPKAA